MRLTLDDRRAKEICEAAYFQRWQLSDSASGSREPDEEWLFDRIRSLALDPGAAKPPDAARPSTPAHGQVEALRVGMSVLDASGRRAVELAYFGGMTVPAIASILALPEPDVRLAMRSALLHLGSLVKLGDGGQ